MFLKHFDKYFAKRLGGSVELIGHDEKSNIPMSSFFGRVENSLVKGAKLPKEVVRSSLCRCKDGYGVLARGLAYKWLDMSDAEDNTITRPYEFSFNAKLRPYQTEAIQSMHDNDGGVILMPTGSGKTIAALGAIASIAQKTLFIAHTSEIINQTAAAAEKIFGESVGYIGGGTLEIKPFTVGLIQSIVNLDQVILDEFGMVILDETHHLPADTFAETMSRCKAKKRFGLTATLERKDGLHGITTAILGDVIYKIDVQDIAEYISLPTVYKVQTNYKTDKANYCFKVCKYHGHCKPIKNIKDKETGVINWKKLKKGSCKILDFRYWQHMLGEFATNEDRNELIMSVFEKTHGEYNLVMTDRVEHAINLGSLMNEKGYHNVKVLHGQVNKYERDAEIQDFKENGGTICATSKLFGEGFDAPDIDRMYLTVPSASKINIKQRLGRAMRKKDEAPIAYDFVDQTEITEASWWKRYKEYKAMGIEVKFYDNPSDNKKVDKQMSMFK